MKAWYRYVTKNLKLNYEILIKIPTINLFVESYVKHHSIYESMA